MVRREWSFCAFAGILAFGWADPATGQNNQELVAARIDEVDDDFAFQGEYMGYAISGESGGTDGHRAQGGRLVRRQRHVGLQVVALGDGKFNAVLYTGGLPGAGWNRRDKQRLSGVREGNRLRLVDGPLEIEVRGGHRAHLGWADLSYDGTSKSRIEKIDRISPTLGAKPPTGAIVLFDGTNTDLLGNGRITEDGLLMEGADTRDAYKDFRLHLEFRLPYMPDARGQGRANSGVYLQSRYEVQILDSFGLEGRNNECGGLYRQRPPDVNMCYPPLRWQTYDITFASPKFDAAGNKTAAARITVRHNGEVIHDNVELTNKTGAGRPEGPRPLPTRLQNHGDPVRFRNIWLVEMDSRPAKRVPPPTQFAGRPGSAQAPVVFTRERYPQGGYYARHPRYSGGYRWVRDYRLTPHPRY